MKLSQETLSDYQIQELLTRTDYRTAELTRSYGDHALAFFGLAPENLHFLTPDGEGLVNYRLIGKVAVVPGDPICAPEAREQVTRTFLEFCTHQKWSAVFYQTSSEYLEEYRTLKLHTFKMGEEAVLNPQTFTLCGSALANVRTSCRRAEREGVVIQWYEGVPPTEVIPQLAQVSNTWLKHKAGEQASERGFSMGRLDELVEAAERADMIAGSTMPTHVSQCSTPRLLTGVALTSSGTVCAFVTFTPTYGLLLNQVTEADSQSAVQGSGWTLDLMRRAPDAPPGVMELLLVRAIEQMRSYGASRLSLGLVAWGDTREEMTSTQQQFTSFVADRLGLLGSRKTLFNFKQKFNPRWESRYIVGTTLASPAVILALLR
ncbi:MAG: DUF2156 domain-containing protein, partial [Chloroflexi bacterium]|nr:DUF2156 domain-containing protein [Chloroflexota bacterium]